MTQTPQEKRRPSVYARIADVQGELAHTGIGKDSENSFDRYKFRGIDAVYNALAPLLAKHGLCVLPRMIERDCQERVSRKGEPMFYVTVTAEFDFVSADDGSIHVVRTYGEAMDRSDKATNKAMSAAYKYAAFMTFAIPTEGDNDADSATPEVVAREPAAKAPPAHSALKTELRAFVHELEGCGDWDTYVAFRETADFKRITKECQDKMPQWWSGGPDMAEEFVPIKRRIELTEANLAESKAAYLTA